MRATSAAKDKGITQTIHHCSLSLGELDSSLCHSTGAEDERCGLDADRCSVLEESSLLHVCFDYNMYIVCEHKHTSLGVRSYQLQCWQESCTTDCPNSAEEVCANTCSCTTTPKGAP